MKRMKRESGFTLIEIMVVIAIMGILAALAMPTYRTWQHRAYGTEATIMAKQILDAQVVYYLEHNKFYPDNTSTEPENSFVFHNDTPAANPDIQAIKNNLNIVIPTGHLLDYQLTADNTNGQETFTLTINSLFNRFDIVKGSSFIRYELDRNGNITNLTFG